MDVIWCLFPNLSLLLRSLTGAQAELSPRCASRGKWEAGRASVEARIRRVSCPVKSVGVQSELSTTENGWTSSSPRMRSAPQSQLLAAISWIKPIVSGESFGLLVCAFDLCFQNTRKSSRCHRSSVVFLDKEKRLFPGPNHPSQNHQQQPICLPICRSLDLPTENHQLVS